jgi:hypothetical protein
VSDRPTPRTDKAEYQVRLGRHRRMVVYPDFARKLERELAEARSEIDQLKRESDNAESDRRQAEADTIRALHERNEARGQRDRLATVLRDIKNRALDETVRLHPDADAKGCVDDCLEWAESALAALKGGTDA